MTILVGINTSRTRLVVHCTASRRRADLTIEDVLDLVGDDHPSVSLRCVDGASLVVTGAALMQLRRDAKTPFQHLYGAEASR